MMRKKTCHAQRIVKIYSTNKHFLYSIIITKQLWNLQTKLQLLKNVFRRIFFIQITSIITKIKLFKI